MRKKYKKPRNDNHIYRTKIAPVAERVRKHADKRNGHKKCTYNPVFGNKLQDIAMRVHGSRV